MVDECSRTDVISDILKYDGWIAQMRVCPIAVDTTKPCSPFRRHSSSRPLDNRQTPRSRGRECIFKVELSRHHVET